MTVAGSPGGAFAFRRAGMLTVLALAAAACQPPPPEIPIAAFRADLETGIFGFTGPLGPITLPSALRYGPIDQADVTVDSVFIEQTGLEPKIDRRRVVTRVRAELIGAFLSWRLSVLQSSERIPGVPPHVGAKPEFRLITTRTGEIEDASPASAVGRDPPFTRIGRGQRRAAGASVFASLVGQAEPFPKEQLLEGDRVFGVALMGVLLDDIKQKEAFGPDVAETVARILVQNRDHDARVVGQTSHRGRPALVIRLAGHMSAKGELFAGGGPVAPGAAPRNDSGSVGFAGYQVIDLATGLVLDGLFHASISVMRRDEPALLAEWYFRVESRI